jgi:hypothetical protein
MSQERYTFRRLQELVGLPADWEIKGFKVMDGVVGVQAVVDSYPDGPCGCGLLQWHRNGTVPAIFQAPPLAGRDVLVKVTRTVWRCRACRKSAGVGSDWPTGSLTRSFEHLILAHALEHVLSKTVQHFGVKRSVVERIVEEHGPRLLAARVVEPPVYLGLDGTNWAKRERAVFVDILQRRRLDILPGYSGPAITEFLQQQGEAWRSSLRAAVIDMSAPFRQALRRYDPHLVVVADRYHVSQRINQGVTRFADAYRQEHGTGCYRFLRTRSEDEYTPAMAHLVRHHPTLMDVHRFAQGIRGVYETESAADARYAWNAWLHDLPQVLVPYLGGTLKNMDAHWIQEICIAVEHRTEDGAVVSNAVTEAMHKAMRRWETLSPNMSLDDVRLRLLLAANARERNRAEQQREERVMACRQALKDASPFPA